MSLPAQRFASSLSLYFGRPAGVVHRCWESSVKQRGMGCSYTTCDQMIYCPLRTSKAPPALQFSTIHLWLQNSMWDHILGPTCLPSLHNVQRALASDEILMCLCSGWHPQDLMDLELNFGEFTSCGHNGHRKFYFYPFFFFFFGLRSSLSAPATTPFHVFYHWTFDKFHSLSYISDADWCFYWEKPQTDYRVIRWRHRGSYRLHE